MTTDRISGSALVCFALLVVWESRHLPFGTVRQPGPAFIPILLALLLVFFGGFVVLAGGRTPLFSSIRWQGWRHALAILAASIFAVFALERLGYRLTMLLVLGFLLKLVERRGWLVSLALAAGLSFGSFFLFYTILRVPLPLGPFGF
ncbi:MAG TPA: tripartite tricarboxylate transporter TctB family protein [Candidatus Binatia bacterium]|nr:tripartite tricarboxylate transporter TctB family protein [Candidatus Binatia bacterium]